MAKGISVGIASDTREFSTGVKKGVIDPLEDAIDALDDVERAGDKAGDKLEDAFKAAQGEVSDFKKDQSDLAREMQRQSKRGGDAVKDNTRKGFDGAKESTDEFKREAASNFSEVTSSFDGSMSSIQDLAQGTLGGLASGLAGPLGIAAGLAAVSIGLIGASLEGNSEETEEFRARVGELAAEFIETGGVGEASLDGILGRLQTLATEIGEGAELPALVKLLEQTGKTGGRNFKDIAAAYAGSSDKLEELIDKETDFLDLLDEENSTILQNADESDEAFLKRAAAAADAVSAQKEIVAELEKAGTAAKDAAAAEEAYLASGADGMAAKAQSIATIDTAYDDAAGSVEGFVAKEQPLFDPAAYIASMQAREEALANYQSALASVDLSPEAKAYIDSQGVDAAAAFLAGYQSSTPAQKAELNRIWAEASKENSGVYKDKITEAFATPIEGPTILPSVVPPPDTVKLLAAIGKTYTMNVGVKYTDARTGKPIP